MESALSDPKLKASYMNDIGTIYCKQTKISIENRQQKSILQKLRKAEKMYFDAINLNPNEVMYFINRANVLIDLKEWKQLEKTLQVLEKISGFDQFTTVLEYQNFSLRLSDLRNVYNKKKENIDHISKLTVKRI